ncbi:MAG: superoxide dismutase family protein [Gemmatimonadaceae bacterium]|nr:superoxide dismutase family protein [Gemmatimonadaceae bacterium]
MRISSVTGASVLALFVACSPAGPDSGQAPAPGDSSVARDVRSDSAARSLNASIQVRSSAGRDLGTLTVTEAAQALSFMGTLRGLPPGVHGVHVHMVGSCDAPAFTSAGAHWNPTDKLHGTDNPQGPHLGDLNNITVAADSSVTVQLTTHEGARAQALMDSDGASVVVHVAADDNHTDPSGNSGDRIACGVISAK